MTTDTLSNQAALESPPETATKSRRWWNPFTRTERPRTERKKRAWLGGRRQAMQELREDQSRLVEALEKLNERLDGGSASAAMEIDPMPVIRGIESISEGQKEISAGLAGLNEHMERVEKTDERLTSAIQNVDKTLVGVRTTQADTASAISRSR